jgi:hypothetical protein
LTYTEPDLALSFRALHVMPSLQRKERVKELYGEFKNDKDTETYKALLKTEVAAKKQFEKDVKKWKDEYGDDDDDEDDEDDDEDVDVDDDEDDEDDEPVQGKLPPAAAAAGAAPVT